MAPENKILNCTNCDNDIDITGYPVGMKFTCPHCQATLAVPKDKKVLPPQPAGAKFGKTAVPGRPQAAPPRRAGAARPDDFEQPQKKSMTMIYLGIVVALVVVGIIVAVVVTSQPPVKPKSDKPLRSNIEEPVKPEPKPEPRPEPKPEPKPEPRPEPKPQPEPEPEPIAKPDPQAQPPSPHKPPEPVQIVDASDVKKNIRLMYSTNPPKTSSEDVNMKTRMDILNKYGYDAFMPCAELIGEDDAFIARESSKIINMMLPADAKNVIEQMYQINMAVTENTSKDDRTVVSQKLVRFWNFMGGSFTGKK